MNYKLIIKIILFSLFSILFSQSEYQILSIPQNLYKLTTNGGEILSQDFSKKINNKYHLSLIQYPSDIRMYDFSMNNFSLSILDYGEFIDQENNVINKIFRAQEILFKYSKNYAIKNHNIIFLVGVFNSKIYYYSSSGIISSIKFRSYYKKINSTIGFAIENLGYILKSYTTYQTSLPLQYRIYSAHSFKDINISYDLISLNNDIKHVFGVQFKINQNIHFRISNSSYLLDLLVDNNNYNFLSGLAMGMNFNFKSLSFGVGYMNLGISGVAYGMSCSFIKL